MTTDPEAPTLLQRLQQINQDGVDRAIAHHAGEEPAPTTQEVASDLLHDAYTRELAADFAVSSPVLNLLRHDLGLERRHHFERVPRRRVTVWWESIWYALFRAIARWVAKRASRDDQTYIEDLGLADMLSSIRPARDRPQLVYDETAEEHVQRLQQLAVSRNSVQVPVHVDRNVPVGSAFLMQPEVQAELEDEAFRASRVAAIFGTSDDDVTVDE